MQRYKLCDKKIKKKIEGVGNRRFIILVRERKECFGNIWVKSVKRFFSARRGFSLSLKGEVKGKFWRNVGVGKICKGRTNMCHF